MRTHHLIGLVLAFVLGLTRPALAQEAGPTDDTSSTANINARYTVERADITVVPDAEVSQELRDAVQGLVGRRLETDEADTVSARLRAAFPGHDVRRRIERGKEPDHIRVIFEVVKREPEWLPFTRSTSKFVYHETAGWSGVLDVPMGSDRHRVVVGGIFDNGDDLVEEYTGFHVRVESRELGTKRLGAGFDVARVRNEWRAETRRATAAAPHLPALYRTRLTVEPRVTVAPVLGVRLSAGMSLTDLESLERSSSSQTSNAGLFGVDVGHRWERPSDIVIRADGAYTLRAGRDGLGSDLVYTKQTASVDYRVDRRHMAFLARFAAGRITGSAPLFERFVLGTSTTLRGWNRLDVAPAGGDRMFHQSIEHRFHGAAVFLDTGSVWDAGERKRIRRAVGFGWHADNAFATLGIPLDATDSGVTFMMGVRF